MDAQADGGGLTLSRFAAAAWRRAWMVVLVTGAAALAGHAVALDHPRVHVAKALLLVGPLKAGIDTLGASGPMAETYAELARSRPVLAETARRVRQRSVGANLEVSANQTTRLLTVEARDPDPAAAARLANAHAASLVALASRRPPAGVRSGKVQVVDPAVPGGAAVGLDPTTLTILAGLLGLAVSLGAVALVESSRSTIRDSGELEIVTGVPCLASVGRAALRHRRTPIVERRPLSRAADEYRLLAAKLDALGARGMRVAVVDLDDVDGPPPPPIASGNGSGGPVAGALALRQTSPSTVEEALRGGSQGARTLLTQLLAESDVVVLHPAGGADSPGGLVWARVAEATLLAVQRGRTPRREVASAVGSLRLVQARLAGAVLTTPPRW